MIQRFFLRLLLYLLVFLLFGFFYGFLINYSKRLYVKIDKIKFIKFFDLIKYKIYDLRHFDKNYFSEYGLTLFCGKQGSGKTISMVEYLYRMKKKYPKCLIYTNFYCSFADGYISSWQDLVSIKNGTDGVIFAIDEIQNEFQNTKWKEFPDFLLAEISQQRKQRVKIVGTSQVYSRVVKQLREQCFEVVECRTFLGRWTFLRAFDAWEYEEYMSNPEKKSKLMRLWRYSFIQSNFLRNSFDTYEKIVKIGQGLEKFYNRYDVKE